MINVEEFFCEILESQECRMIEYRAYAISEYMGFHIDWNNPLARLEKPFIPLKEFIVEAIERDNTFIDELVKKMLNTDKSGYVLYALSTQFGRKESITQNDFIDLVAERQIITPFADDINIDDLAFVVEAYVLDNLVPKPRSILDICQEEEFAHPTNSYKLTRINGAEFRKDGLIFDGKGYLYNPYTRKTVINPMDQIPGFSKIITEECGVCDIWYRLDERLAVSEEEYEDYTGVSFAKIYGPQLDFEEKYFPKGKNIIVHIDIDTMDKLLMIVKTGNVEDDEEFWHIEIETLPKPKKKGNYITTFLHGMYYPLQKQFSHIDYAINEYRYETYENKYGDSKNGNSIDEHTEYREQHYKIWCIENGRFSIKTWYKLVIVSLNEKYQKLFKEMLNE